MAQWLRPTARQLVARRFVPSASARSGPIAGVHKARQTIASRSLTVNMASVPSLKLSNGKEIPQVGLGTWQSKPGEVESAVAYALKEAGYRWVTRNFPSGVCKESVLTDLTYLATLTARLLMGMKRRLAMVSSSQASLVRKSLLPARSGMSTNNASPRSTIENQSIIRGTWHNRVEEQLKITLERLGTDYLDRMLARSYLRGRNANRIPSPQCSSSIGPSP